MIAELEALRARSLPRLGVWNGWEPAHLNPVPVGVEAREVLGEWGLVAAMAAGLVYWDAFGGLFWRIDSA